MKYDSLPRYTPSKTNMSQKIVLGRPQVLLKNDHFFGGDMLVCAGVSGGLIDAKRLNYRSCPDDVTWRLPKGPVFVGKIARWLFLIQ